MTEHQRRAGRVLLLAHTGREEAREVARAFCKALTGHGIVVRLLADEAARPRIWTPRQFDPPVELAADESDAGQGCELAVVIGGDGTILRAAELTHASGTPVLGRQPRPRRASSPRRSTTTSSRRSTRSCTGATPPRTGSPSTCRCTATARSCASTFALNEASVEKAARERMLEVVVEIDGRPLSRWGCDGVVCATPTGSTAYNFTAGGPIVWPGVEALLMVPISAHALFARPMVVAPTSVLAVEVLARTEGAGVLWCDGRRTVDLPPGARIEVRRGERAGPAGPAARGAVHRPAGRQVRPAGRGLARRQRAAPSPTSGGHADA